MKRQGLLALIAVVLVAPVVRAGVYNTAEADWPLSKDFYEFRNLTLIPLRQLGSPETHTPLNRRYQFISARLNRTGNLTIEERLNLSAYMIRFGKAREAVEILMPAYQQERENFLVLANLATAEQLVPAALEKSKDLKRDPAFVQNQLRRAEGWLRAAVDAWPEKFQDLPEAKRKWFSQIGWSEHPYDWYREVEKYHLDLVKLRAREANPTALPEAPDALFGVIQFVGDSSKFEPGKLDLGQRKKLPAKAIPIVQQLLIWLPDDARLYWLLGELYNAEGKIDEARDIFEEIDQKWNPKSTGKGLSSFQSNRANPKLFQEHLDALKAVPRTPVIIPDLIKPPPPEDDPPAPKFDWRAFGVGILFGLFLALFGYWQIREIRRRRQSRVAVK